MSILDQLKVWAIIGIYCVGWLLVVGLGLLVLVAIVKWAAGVVF